jgi:hypothetical protein
MKPDGGCLMGLKVLDQLRRCCQSCVKHDVQNSTRTRVNAGIAFWEQPNNPSPANPTILEFRLFYTYPQKTIIPYLERR